MAIGSHPAEQTHTASAFQRASPPDAFIGKFYFVILGIPRTLKALRCWFCAFLIIKLLLLLNFIMELIFCLVLVRRAISVKRVIVLLV